MICSNCQTANEAQARFCKNCGFAISDLAADTRQLSPPDGERRVVTILFCDLKGSTSMAKHLDPEDWAEIMNEVFKQLIEPVNRYGGTVARLMGDAILAYFGAPTAHEDDPQRAVLAGLEILSNIRQFNQRLRESSGLDFEVRVGINTGLVVVGEIGADRHTEYTAMGDAVNLAARMEQTARPGTVQITQETYRLVKPFFDVADLGEIEVKGQPQTVRAYRALGPRSRPGPLRGLLGTSAPLVGRQDQVRELVQALTSVRQGRGQIVCLLGEAGIGKTRLIEELRDRWYTTSDQLPENTHAVPSGTPSWLEAHSISYAAHLPYGTFQQLLRSVLDVSPEHTPDEIRDKSVRKFRPDQGAGQPGSQVSSPFDVLLGAALQSDHHQLEGEAFKRELFDAMLSTWRELTAQQSTVLVFDDLHWADQASVELLIHLFKLVEERPVLLLCAFRPERESPAWEVRQAAERYYHHQYTEIHLQPLTQEESASLIGDLLSSIELPTPLREVVMRKSEGNPFFIEQIVQSLIETGVIASGEDGGAAGKNAWKLTSPLEKIAIPDTVQALLQARIDRLDAEVRQTLQKAAVIGRSFSYRLLHHTLSEDVELDRHLLALEKVDLVRETARIPELEYSFRHTLAQETAYRTILRRRRRQYHQQVAEAFERLYPDRVEEAAPLLAHHFAEAGEARALHYFTVAGDQAYRLYAIDDAISHYTQALEIAEKMQQFDVLEHLYTRRGRALELTSRYELALDNYSELEELSGQLGDQNLLLAALLGRATVLSLPSPSSNPDQARQVLNQALALARQLGDRPAQARILWNLTLLEARSGDLHQAIEYGEQAVALCRELNLDEQLAFTLNNLGEVYGYTGMLDRGRDSILEAQQIWQRLDNKPMLADSYSSAAIIHAFNGDFDQAIASSEEAMRISISINSLWGQAYSLASIMNIHLGSGEVDRSIAAMERCILLAEQAGFVVPLSITRIALGLLYASLGARDCAVEMAEAGKKYLPQLVPTMVPEAQSCLTRLFLLTGNITEAEATYCQIDRLESDIVSGGFEYLAQSELGFYKKDFALILQAAGRLVDIGSSGLRYFLQYGYYYQGLAEKGLGELEEARRSLQSGRAESEKLNSRLLLWQILAELAEVEQRLGNHEEAAFLHSQVVELIDYIASRAAKASSTLITGEELRASFLAREEVKAAINMPQNYWD
jgi:class 3 adenylate cyclase/tetratricopeptide (TPR) repeat protein